MVDLSTTKAEYMALTEAVKEAIYLRGLLEELGVKLNIVAVNCKNQNAIHLSRNYVFHERTKHINVRYHFIKEVLEGKTVKVLKVSTEHNVADALMKVLEEMMVYVVQISTQQTNKRSTTYRCICSTNFQSIIGLTFERVWEENLGPLDIDMIREEELIFFIRLEETCHSYEEEFMPANSSTMLEKVRNKLTIPSRLNLMRTKEDVINGLL
ncbi:retrovirus-related pol polyprotein from transposon TNT 1-94 [Tanacetum coccineum]